MTDTHLDHVPRRALVIVPEVDETMRDFTLARHRRMRDMRYSMDTAWTVDRINTYRDKLGYSRERVDEMMAGASPPGWIKWRAHP
jgi:hypothetical protein